MKTSTAVPVGAAPAGDDAEARTRDRVTRSILENGPSTATALAQRLGLSPPAVRRHLDALVSGGVLASSEQRTFGQRGRGRPARVFALTDSGRGAFHQAYDDLAVDALGFLASSGGDAAVLAFARTRTRELEARYLPLVEGPIAGEGAPVARAQALAAALSADGYAATTRTAPGGAGVQVCQHHCPVAHVAERFPQLCEAETEVFARLLGTHVQRLATIAHGDGVCTTHVPAAHPTPTPAAPETPAAPTRRTTS